MSYDLVLDGSSNPVSPAVVRTAVKAVFGTDALTAGEHIHRVDVTLSWVDSNGDATDGALVNRVEVHRGHSEDAMQLASRVASAVAAATGWSGFDPQLDLPFTRDVHCGATFCVPIASPVFVNVSPSGTRLALRRAWRLTAEVREVRDGARVFESGEFLLQHVDWLDDDAIALSGWDASSHVPVLRRVRLGEAGFDEIADARVRDVRGIDANRALFEDGWRVDFSSGEITRAIDDGGPLALARGAGRVAMRAGVYSVDDGACVHAFGEGAPTLRAIALSPNGDRIAIAAYGAKSIQVFTAGEPDPIATFRRCGEVQTLVFTPDGSGLVSTSKTGVSFAVWGIEAGKRTASPKTAIAYDVWERDCRRAPDAKPSRHWLSAAFLNGRLVSSHIDGRVCVWDDAHRRLRGTFAFTEDGGWLVTTDGEYDHSEGFVGARFYMDTDMRRYTHCVLQEELAGRRAPGLWSRVLGR